MKNRQEDDKRAARRQWLKNRDGLGMNSPYISIDRRCDWRLTFSLLNPSFFRMLFLCESTELVVTSMTAAISFVVLPSRISEATRDSVGVRP